MMAKNMLKGALLASAGLLVIGGAARADDMQAAKDYIAKVTSPVTAWEGPTTGPKAAGKKLIVVVSTDQRNGGARGVSEGVEEAAKVLGWDVRVIDGQGSVSARAAGISQAIARRPTASCWMPSTVPSRLRLPEASKVKGRLME